VGIQNKPADFRIFQKTIACSRHNPAPLGLKDEPGWKQ
jgi:hypothetical protein